jgi:hypothetical protein
MKGDGEAIDPDPIRKGKKAKWQGLTCCVATNSSMSSSHPSSGPDIFCIGFSLILRSF